MQKERAGAGPLAEGVWRITTPMRGRPRSVHAYLVEIEAGRWFLLDSGVASDEAWAALDAGVRGIAGAWERISLHVVTHMHRDHNGLASRVVQRSGASLVMGSLDAQRVAHATAHPEDETAFREELLRRCGVPGELHPELLRATRPAPGGEFHPPDLELDGESGPLPDAPGWSYVWTPGHTAGHLALLRAADRLLLAGDAILPRVTPTIGVNRQRVDPVEDYLGALLRLERLEPARALCGHGDPLEEPLARIQELADATRAETARVLDALRDSPSTAWEVVQRIYRGRSLPPAVTMLALRETLAHLIHASRTVRAERGRDDGAEVFSRATPAP